MCLLLAKLIAHPQLRLSQNPTVYLASNKISAFHGRTRRVIKAAIIKAVIKAVTCHKGRREKMSTNSNKDNLGAGNSDKGRKNQNNQNFMMEHLSMIERMTTDIRRKPEYKQQIREELEAIGYCKNFNDKESEEEQVIKEFARAMRNYDKHPYTENSVSVGTNERSDCPKEIKCP